MPYIKYIVYAPLSVFCLVWFFSAIKKSEKHEMTMSLGALTVITLCFDTFWDLIPLNVWTLNDIPPLKIIGLSILSISGVTAALTVATMIILGKPKKGWEETTQLIEWGTFSLIRHPLYFAAFLAALGIFLVDINLISIVALIICTPLFFLSAYFEDQWNLDKFGEAYRRYQVKTKMFFPFIY